jgi:glycosyltransferase involved in cell wall biosynthesis
MDPPTAVIIPALNEAGNIAMLVQELSEKAAVNWIIVADNGSDDGTGQIAAAAGAEVTREPRRGYGYACAAGSALALKLGAEILVYMDGDRSSLVSELEYLLKPLILEQADLVLGSRVLGQIAAGAMPAHQRFGNRLSSWLMRSLYGLPVTDLGPYRAIRATLLQKLNMRETTFGWPAEMMVKAARLGAPIKEVPVSWHNRRAGRSKVGGTLRGSFLAAYHILAVSLRYAFVKLD